MDNERQYYAQWGQEQLGPISRSRLLQDVDRGAIPHDALACAEGDASWQPLAAVVASLRTARVSTFYVNAGSRVSGPFSVEEIERDLQFGVLSPDSFVRPIDGQHWQRVTSMLETVPRDRSPFAGRNVAPAVAPVVLSPSHEAFDDAPVDYRSAAPGARQPVATALPAADGPIQLALGPAETFVLDLSGQRGNDGYRGNDGFSGSDGRRLSDVIDRNGVSRRAHAPGGDGGEGTDGGDGTHGKNALSAQLRLETVGDVIRLTGSGGVHHQLVSRLRIDARGGDGGDGGKGGDGGRGGSGDPDGRKGRDGNGGDGGDGGDGGTIELSTGDVHLLSLVDDALVGGGQGGSGGRGSHNGASGREGQHGSYVLLARSQHGTEQGSTFGLTPCELTITDDGTRLGGHFARRSKFTITHLRILNDGDFSLPAPFFVALQPEVPIDFDVQTFPVTKHPVPAHGSVDVPCQVNGSVRAIGDVGTYRVRIATFSRRGPLTLPLNRGREDAIIPLSVNHRLVPSDITVSSPEAAAHIEQLAAFWNAQSPERQAAFFAAAVMTAASMGKELPQARRDQLAAMLSGPLLAPNALYEHLAQPHAAGEAPLAAAKHFFGDMPADSRAKVMDAAYFVTTSDGVVEQHEKDLLLSLARQLGLDDDWLSEHMPKVLARGSSKVRASATNLVALFAFPVAVVSAFLSMHRIVQMKSLGPASINQDTLLFWLLATASTVFATQLVYRQLCYRAACRACGSIRLKALEKRARKGSLIGSADVYRCTDCGARGNLEAGDPSELRAADCPVAPAKSLPWRPVLLTGVLVVFAYLTRLDAPQLPAPDDLEPWVFFLFVGTTLWALVTHRARRLPQLAPLVLVLFSVVGTWSACFSPAPAIAPPARPALPASPQNDFPKGQKATIGNTGGKGVPLQRSPLDATAAHTLREGTAIEFTGNAQHEPSGNWAEVTCSAGTGWVNAKNLVRAAPAPH